MHIDYALLSQLDVKILYFGFSRFSSMAQLFNLRLRIWYDMTMIVSTLSRQMDFKL